MTKSTKMTVERWDEMVEWTVSLIGKVTNQPERLNADVVRETLRTEFRIDAAQAVLVWRDAVEMFRRMR
jgi:hypothetical protein